MSRTVNRIEPLRHVALAASPEAKGLASILTGAAQVIKDGEAEEVMKQIAALRNQLDGKPRDADDEPSAQVLPPPLKQIASH